MVPVHVTTYLFSYTLLHNRLMGYCHLLLKEYEAAGEQETLGVTAGGRDPAMKALSVILHADTTVEIAINHRIETCLPSRVIASPLREVFRQVRTAMWRRHPPLERLAELGRILAVEPDWRKAEPWPSVGLLHALRNALAHYEAGPVASNHPEADIFPRRAQLEPLAQRIGTRDRLAHGWLAAFLNPVCARWSYDTADAALKELGRRGGPWDKALRFE